MGWLDQSISANPSTPFLLLYTINYSTVVGQPQTKSNQSNSTIQCPLIESATSRESNAHTVDLAHTLDTTGGLVTIETLWVFRVVFTGFFCGGISIVGIITNSLTVYIFIKQGLHDSVNISLLTLAVADLCSVTLMLWTSIWEVIDLTHPPPFLLDPYSVSMITGTLPRIILNRVSCWLTALISVERCVCVAFPFKVKVIFTRRNSSLLASSVFFVIFTSHLSIYSSRYLAPKWIPALNITRYSIVAINEPFEVVKTSLLFLFLPLMNISFIILCTVVLIVKLKVSTSWRKNTGTGNHHVESATQVRLGLQREEIKVGDSKGESRGGAASAGSKDARVTKMISTIMVIFVMCNTPSNVLLAASAIIPGFNEIGMHSRLFVCVYILTVLLETVNATVNFFVYYAMSSKFKATYVILSSVCSKLIMK